jgi:hypothetical protein
MKLIGGTGTIPANPYEQELYCLAANNPDTFYLRDLNNAIVSGTSLNLSGEWDAAGECGGEGGNEPGEMWGGYICPSTPSAVNCSASGTGRGGGSVYGGGLSGCNYTVDGEQGNQSTTETDPDDCCATTSYFGSDFTSSVIQPCCPVVVEVSINPGSACTEEGHDGQPEVSISVAVSLVPES